MSYRMAINNTKAFIRSDENREAVAAGQGISAFDASIILAIAFCKSKEEVILDLIDRSVNEPNTYSAEPHIHADSADDDWQSNPRG